MKIGIEAERANHPQKTGVEHYAKQLILHLAKIDPNNQYILYLRTRPQAWFLELPKNFKVKVMPFPIFWTQLRLSWEMVIDPVDSLLIPASAMPVIHPHNSVAVIHDLAWKYFPQSFTKPQLYFLYFFTWFASHFSRKLIAVSQATKNDLVKYYHLPPEKIVVVHHGFEASNPLPGQGADLRLPDKYVLFLSTLQPRKNLDGLIKAFNQLKSQHPNLPHKLVVVGKPGWKYGLILKLIEQYKEQVVYLNHISDGERFRVLAGADLLVLPSFYEGFGMQILEAFSAGVPVATSKVSSMPEVAGEAAVYFDPKSISQVKDAIQSVLLDRSLHDSLVLKGKKRLSSFSWEKCAKETLKVLTE